MFCCLFLSWGEKNLFVFIVNFVSQFYSASTVPNRAFSILQQEKWGLLLKIESNQIDNYGFCFVLWGTKGWTVDMI